ncbi:MAG: ThuA domain-containing protein, partial [Actinobacteria bacterium]
MVASLNGSRVEVTLVAGGKYHDIDFARRELLGLLAEHDECRVRVQPDYEDVAAIVAGSILVSYTCDVRPSLDAQLAIRDWVESGGRWVALHGTNSALDLGGPNGVDSPRVFPLWADTLGSQFVAHPPIQPYTVKVSDSDHWLVTGIEPFETDDELYLSEYPDRAALVPLLLTTWSGEARGFVEADWTTADPTHLVMYLRPLGAGSVLYNTLGHCRGHYDMVPVLDYYPVVERCSWDRPVYYELLR